jgi:DNA-binding CsgD family transcriptional regulator
VIWGTPPDLADDDHRRIRAIHAELGHLDPLRNALSTPGAIHTLDEVVDREMLAENRFYREVLRPYGLEKMIGMYISEPGGWEGNVGLTNGGEDADFGEPDKEMLAALRPHLEQSLAIFARMSREESELHALTDTLDRLTISTLILNSAGAILRANGAARRMLASGDIVRARDQCLVLVDRNANAEFQEVIAAAIASRGTDDGAFAQALRATTSDERQFGILVRSLPRDTPYAGETGPACIVYLTGAQIAQPLERLVMQLFDLTPSEAHLTTLLATGFSLSESADKLGVTESTVRTYCKTIMGKVGVSRQADLITLVLRSVAVLG